MANNRLSALLYVADFQSQIAWGRFVALGTYGNKMDGMTSHLMMKLHRFVWLEGTIQFSQ